jgi:glycosyltransferase involved in cell wall biosynthesis
MFLSAIMPVFNAERHVAQAIQSILSQTFDEWELVIVDDGSTDSSYGICRHFAERDDRIRLFDYPHAGRAAARNHCLQHSTGDVVVICDADDLSFSTRFESHVEHFQCSADLGISTAPIQIVFADDMDVRRMHYFKYECDPATIRRRFSRKRMAISNASSAISRRVFDKFGEYDLRFRRAQDYEFFKRVIQEVEILCTEIPLIMYRANRTSFTWDYFWESRRYHWLADNLDSLGSHTQTQEKGTLPSPGPSYRTLAYLRFGKYLIRTAASRRRGLSAHDRERVQALLGVVQAGGLLS